MNSAPAHDGRRSAERRLRAGAVSFLGALLLALCPLTLSAQETVMPSKLRVAFVLKTIEYDLNMKGRAPGGPRILVIGRPDQEVSAAEAQEMTQEFVTYFSRQAASAGGAEKLVAASWNELRRKLDEKRSQVMVLTQALGEMAQPVINYAIEKKILVLGSERKQLDEGAAVCLLLKGGKPKILIRVKAALLQGANFDPRLLRLAEVVDPAK